MVPPSFQKTLFQLENKLRQVQTLERTVQQASSLDEEEMAYFSATDRGGNHLLYQGACAEARVVSVIRPGIFAEIFGVETFIPLRELSYQRMLDATAAYQLGQRVVVKLLEIHREDRDHIQVAASVKQANANPYEKALKRYSVGNRYVGTVSMVDTTGVRKTICTMPVKSHRLMTLFNRRKKGLNTLWPKEEIIFPADKSNACRLQEPLSRNRISIFLTIK